MENKNNKGLVWLIVILIILVVALMGFVLYREFYIEEKNSGDTTTTNNVVEEPKKLSDEEIEKYLSYVPVLDEVQKDIEEIYDYSVDAYTKDKVNVKDLNIKLLMKEAYSHCNILSNVSDLVDASFCGDEPCEADGYYSIEEFNKNMANMYNINKISETSFAIVGGVVQKTDKYYVEWMGAGGYGTIKTNKVLNYNIENENLFIYEKAGFATVTDYGDGDLVILKSTNINDVVKKDTTDSMSIEAAEKYIRTNIDSFNTYKHTFKQHDDGTYYWYSTELEK